MAYGRALRSPCVIDGRREDVIHRRRIARQRQNISRQVELIGEILRRDIPVCGQLPDQTQRTGWVIIDQPLGDGRLQGGVSLARDGLGL